jgi:hypothetical protein
MSCGTGGDEWITSNDAGGSSLCRTPPSIQSSGTFAILKTPPWQIGATEMTNTVAYNELYECWMRIYYIDRFTRPILLFQRVLLGEA